MRYEIKHQKAGEEEEDMPVAYTSATSGLPLPRHHATTCKSARDRARDAEGGGGACDLAISRAAAATRHTRVAHASVWCGNMGMGIMM